MSRTSGVLGAFALLLAAGAALGGEPRPVVSIRVAHPDRQMREVIGLFAGSRAADPAAALSAWKRASREPTRFGKRVDALIAAFNPAMADEFRIFDGAEVDFWIDPGDGRLAWGASIPRDDGTFQALATAMVLTGGRTEDRPGDVPADRLAGPDSPWMARGDSGSLIAGALDDLRVIRERAARARDLGTADPDGFRLAVEHGALDGARSLNVHRLAEALGPSTGPVVARLALHGASATASLDLSAERPVATSTIDPTWLDWVPSGRALAGFAMAIAPEGGAWDAAFELADRVERVDPIRANLAPLRLRLGLLARSAGVRTEVDLIPHLRGVSGWLGADGREPDAGLVALHLDAEDAAIGLVHRIRWSGRSAEEARALGEVDGRPVQVHRVGRSVAIAWGPSAFADSVAALRDPARSAGPSLREGWIESPPVLAGGFWPGRCPGLVAESTPLAQALGQSPPVTWTGARSGPNSYHLLVRWDGLDSLVRRFLALIPFDPPPDR